MVVLEAVHCGVIMCPFAVVKLTRSPIDGYDNHMMCALLEETIIMMFSMSNDSLH